MQCEKVKDLLMTDYIDKELDEPLSKEVEGHIESCGDCRSLKETLEKAAIKPLEDSQKQMPPEHLWQKIKANIEEEASSRSSLIDILHDLGSLLRKRRPAFAFATAAAIVLILVSVIYFPINGHKELNTYLEEQGSFFSSINEESGYADKSVVDFGTGIEEYFL